MKEDGRLGRTFLAGATSDTINVTLVAARGVANMLHFHVLVSAAEAAVTLGGMAPPLPDRQRGCAAE